MASVLYRLGGWCFRHRGRVVAAWLVLIVALAILAVSVKKSTTSSVTIPGTQSQQALDLLNKQFPGTGGAQAQVVFSVTAPASLTSATDRDAVEATLAGLRKAPQVVSVSDPYKSATVATSNRVAYATVAYPVSADKVTSAAKHALLHSGGPAEAAGVTVSYGGEVAQASTTSSTELVGIIVAFFVLFIGFGSVFAAIIPLAAAIVVVAVAELAVLALTAVISETNTTSILAIMLGLAVGIDYSLLILNRYRQHLIEGMTPQKSASIAVATSGSAVVFAGTTVLIALAALSIVQIPFLTTMGLAAAGAVVMAVTVAVTLVPALLGVSGTRLVEGRLARRQLAAATAPGFRSLSRRYVTAVTRRPLAILLVGVILLLAVASPALRIQLGLPDAGSQPTGQTTRRAYDLISQGFGPGANGPLLVVVYAPGGPTSAQISGFTSYYSKVRAAPGPGVAFISSPVLNPANDLVLITVVPKTGPNDPKTKQLIRQIRQVAVQGQKMYGLQTFVTGTTAVNVDISSKLSSALPIYLAVIVVLCMLLLLVVFRSLLVPAKAVIGYVLSLLAALGAVTFVFQEGHVAGLFSVASPGPILSFLPILLIGVLFGLAMDYEVFLVSRMREDFIRTTDAPGAVVDGYSDTAKVVTSAGIIMTAVFASFILSADPTTKSIGFSFALGVLIDAFVVRMTLVPAAMKLFGRAAWWLPTPLDKAVPNLDIEGSHLATIPD